MVTQPTEVVNSDNYQLYENEQLFNQQHSYINSLSILIMQKAIPV